MTLLDKKAHEVIDRKIAVMRKLGRGGRIVLIVYAGEVREVRVEEVKETEKLRVS